MRNFEMVKEVLALWLEDETVQNYKMLRWVEGPFRAGVAHGMLHAACCMSPLLRIAGMNRETRCMLHVTCCTLLFASASDRRHQQRNTVTMRSYE